MVGGADVEVTNTLAVEFVLSHYNMAGNQVCMGFMVGWQSGFHTQEQDTLFVFLVHYDTYAIAYMQNGVHIWQLILTIRANKS